MDGWPPASPFSIDYLWVGIICWLSSAQLSAVSICSARHLLWRGRGGVGTDTLHTPHTLSHPQTQTHIHQNALRSFLTSSKQMRAPRIHAYSRVPASRPACVLHPCPSRTGSRSLLTCTHAEDAGRERFREGEPRNYIFLEAVGQRWTYQLCVLHEHLWTWSRDGLTEQTDRRTTGGPASACVRELCARTRPTLRLLQMVRTLAHFSISLGDMNEHGENAGNEGGEKDGGGEDPMDLLRNKRDGDTRVNLDGNGLGTGSPNGEVQLVFSGLCISVHPPPWCNHLSSQSLYNLVPY